MTVCTCGAYDAREALAVWGRRAAPVVARLIRHGHAVDTRNMTVTVGLVILLEQMDPQVFSDENRHRSHHLPNCPWAPRNRGTTPGRRRGLSVHLTPPPDRVAAFVREMETFVKEHA